MEFIFLDGRGDVELTIRDIDLSTSIEELGGDVLVGVEGVLRLNGNGVRATGCSWVNWQDRFEFGLGGIVTRGVFVEVGGHG